MSFTLGMVGPIVVAEFREHLRPGVWRDDVPKGLGGSPVNLLSRELLSRGQKLVIFTLDPAVEDEVCLDGEGLRIYIGPYRPKRARDFFTAERRYLLRAIRRERPDVIHAQWTYEFALAAQASGVPHVITAHDAPLNVLRRNFIPYRIARTVMAYAVTARAARLVSVSPYVAEHLRRFMLYRGTDDVVPNGMPDHLFHAVRRNTVSRRAVTYATVLNGWGGFKNGAAAVEAFARVHLRRPDDRLVMFGAGHGNGDAGATWARQRGIAAGIEFAGTVSHGELLRRLADEADVLVHPSLEEAQPMAVIEALALGVPVVGGRCSGGVPWTLDDGHAGVLVDVKSPQQIAEAMLRLADDASERNRFGRSGKEHAARRFHIRAVADAYQARYRELLDVGAGNSAQYAHRSPQQS